MSSFRKAISHTTNNLEVGTCLEAGACRHASPRVVQGSMCKQSHAAGAARVALSCCRWCCCHRRRVGFSIHCGNLGASSCLSTAAFGLGLLSRTRFQEA